MKVKKVVAFMISLGLAALLASCANRVEAVQTSYTPAQISGMIWETQSGSPEPHRVTLDDEAFGFYLEGYYGMETSLFEDGAIYYAGGADASEVAVLHLKDDSDVPLVEDQLLSYIDARIGDFFGYMPAQVHMLENAVVSTAGSHVALLICADPLEAQSTFSQCFQGDGVSTQAIPVYAGVAEPEVEELAEEMEAEQADPYDSAAVLAAWRTGDTSSLSDKNRTILEECARVIDEVTTDSMTAYEKELAVHDWIVKWAAYDEAMVDHAPNAQPDPDNDNPYGVLVGQKAICSGYSSTFQLFMDMLDIECITVEGFAHSTREDHAWNMVRLDGEWYCVDVTWNDPVGLEEYHPVYQHDFFNVTSEKLRETIHEWDYDEVPEATATTYRWRGDGGQQG